MTVRESLLRLLVTTAVAGAAVGCYTSDEVLDPPTTTFYFPTGVVVSPGGTTLYVINSDFDLQYNGGTVQALDLAAIRPKLQTLTDQFIAGKGAEDACAAVGLLRNGERIPGTTQTT